MPAVQMREKEIAALWSGDNAESRCCRQLNVQPQRPLCAVMRIFAIVTFCVYFAWGQQAQPPTSQAPAPTVPQPTAEMQRLTNMLAGRWSIRQDFEPRVGLSKGRVGQGTEGWRPGPGSLSLMEEIQTRVGDREFSGLGLIW